VTTYPVNAAGYVTNSDYYGTATPPDGACYCDIYSQYSPDGSTLLPLGYYSLGTPSEPAMCQFGNIQDQNPTDNTASTACEVVTQEGGGYGNIQTMCKCATSNAAPLTGSIINSTTPQISTSVNQALINDVLNEEKGQEAGSSNNSKGGVSSNSGTNSNSGGNSQSTNTAHANAQMLTRPSVLVGLTMLVGTLVMIP
jgi:hypothetical protein